VHGEAIAFGGRVLGDEMPKYLNSPDTPLFKKRETLYALSRAKDGIREKGYAIVVEGYLDAIMCHQYGFTNTVAPLGTALTEGHVKKLNRLAGNLLLIFDGDAAGIAAAKRSMPLVLNQGIRTKILLLQKGEDPDKILLLQKGEDPDSILKARGADHMKNLIAGSSTPVEFLLKVQGSRLEATNEAIEIISVINDPVLRDELILELSERTRIGERSIREKLNRYRRTGSHISQRPKSRPYDEETLLLSAAIALPDKAAEIADRISIDDIRNPAVKDLLKKLGVEGQSVEALMSTGSEEEKNLLSMLSVKPGFDILEVDKNVEDCLKQITKRHMDNEIKRVNEEIRSAEMAGNLKLLNRLLSERQRLIHGAK
jgi:DNA primase